MRFTLIVSAIIWAASAYAQNPGPVYQTRTVPTGSCGQNIAYLVDPSGQLYSCQSGTWALAGGGVSAVPKTFSAACVNTAAGASLSTPSGGVTPVCDGANGSVFSYLPFINSATTYAITPPIPIDSAYADPVNVTACANSTVTSGTVTFKVGVNELTAAVSTNWWTTVTLHGMNLWTAPGTASLPLCTTYSFSTGITAPSSGAFKEIQFVIAWDGTAASGTPLVGTVQFITLQVAAKW